ncbi:MAG: hypothetical protein H6Q17_359 [Bacteroidetes bacterium]|nr:hypothetical protein [Bacteroidota bacterium]
MKLTSQVQINKKTRQQHQIISTARFRASIRPSHCTPTIGVRGGYAALLPDNCARRGGGQHCTPTISFPGGRLPHCTPTISFPGGGLSHCRPTSTQTGGRKCHCTPTSTFPGAGLPHCRPTMLFFALHRPIIQQPIHKNMKYVLIAKHNKSFFHNKTPLFFKSTDHIIKQHPIFGCFEETTFLHKQNICIYYQSVYAIFSDKQQHLNHFVRTKTYICRNEQLHQCIKKQIIDHPELGYRQVESAATNSKNGINYTNQQECFTIKMFRP